VVAVVQQPIPPSSYIGTVQIADSSAADDTMQIFAERAEKSGIKLQSVLESDM